MIFIDHGLTGNPCAMCYLDVEAHYKIYDHNSVAFRENNGKSLFPFFLCKAHGKELQLKLASVMYQEKYL